MLTCANSKSYRPTLWPLGTSYSLPKPFFVLFGVWKPWRPGLELLWTITDQEIRERALRWDAENRGRRAAERAQRLRTLRLALFDIYGRNPDLPRSFLRYLAWAWSLDLRTLETMLDCYLEFREAARARLNSYWLPHEDRILMAYERDLAYAVHLVNRFDRNIARGIRRSIGAARRRLRLLKRGRELGWGPIYV